MKDRDFEFVLASVDSDLDSYNVRAYSIKEALPKAFIHAHNLRTSTGKEWKIVNAKDLTHFDNVKKARHMAG